MKTEISLLFHLGHTFEFPVSSCQIGDGVCIEEISNDWLEEAKRQCPKIAAREQLHFVPTYTHRFYYEMEAEESEWTYINENFDGEKQLIIRAVVLSRIIKPTSIAYGDTWVKSFYRNDNTVRHYSNPVVNGFSAAYVGKDETDNTITEEDAINMARLWESFQYFWHDDNEPKYRRIVRAFKHFEFAHYIYLAEIRHPVFHSALESMICAGHYNNKAQVTQRLPQLVPFINAEQANDIYLTCCDFKHAAQALIQQEKSKYGLPSPSDQRRIDAVRLLKQAVSYLLLESLRNRNFADVLVDVEALKSKYPVQDKKGKIV